MMAAALGGSTRAMRAMTSTAEARLIKMVICRVMLKFESFLLIRATSRVGIFFNLAGGRVAPGFLHLRHGRGLDLERETPGPEPDF